MRKLPREEAQRWLEQAREDLKWAQILISCFIPPLEKGVRGGI